MFNIKSESFTFKITNKYNMIQSNLRKWSKQDRLAVFLWSVGRVDWLIQYHVNHSKFESAIVIKNHWRDRWFYSGAICSVFTPIPHLQMTNKTTKLITITINTVAHTDTHTHSSHNHFINFQMKWALHILTLVLSFLRARTSSLLHVAPFSFQLVPIGRSVERSFALVLRPNFTCSKI